MNGGGGGVRMVSKEREGSLMIEHAHNNDEHN